MNQYSRKEKTITFEANEKLFAEFIAWKEAKKNFQTLGYISSDSYNIYADLSYKPIRETEVVKMYRELSESLSRHNDKMKQEADRYYFELKKLKDDIANTPTKTIPKKRKSWF